MFKVLAVDHIGIAVKDLEEGKNFWSDVIGIPCTAEDSPITKYIEKKGEGIQHIALRVDNIENAIADLMAKGVKMIDEKPRIGAGGAKIAFLHPKSTKGVLLEICEHEDR